MAILNGTTARNYLNGNGSADRLNGNSGDDFLFGGGGSDQIYGGAGNDVIVGGDRPDLLYGGLGADSFKLAQYYDSKKWENLYDSIEDFSAWQGDRIDLSAIDANAFVGGNQSFRFASGDSVGSVWTKRRGADLFVNARFQNDKMISIKLDDFSGQLDGGDFIL